MRLIHYSNEPLTKVYSKPHSDKNVGAYKTPGLWFSVEGDDDWPAWCKAEDWDLGKCATEIILADDARVLHLRDALEIDVFTERYGQVDPILHSKTIAWPAVREFCRGLIIAPYVWSRRLSEHTFWYYGWDCASGVIWDADAIKELRPVALRMVEETHG